MATGLSTVLPTFTTNTFKKSPALKSIFVVEFIYALAV